MHRVRLRIKGRVQGVFFRASAKEAAMNLGVTGWVKNQPDGTVETVAEGKQEALDRFIEWCREGPENASVADVEVDRQEATGEFDTFTIKH